MLFPPEYMFLWLLVLFAISYFCFKKKALILWGAIAPVVLAIKLGVPHIVISTAAGTMVAAMAFSALTQGEMKRLEYPEGHPVRQTYQAMEFSLKTPIWFAIAVTFIINIVAASALVAVFDTDKWMTNKGWSQDVEFGLSVGVSFLFVLAILCGLFMKVDKVPAEGA